MKLTQAELKKVEGKSLVSGDCSIRLTIDINNPDGGAVDTNYLNSLMHKPLELLIDSVEE